MEQRRDAAGRIERRPVSPVVELHYLVTAWATEQRDEHQLLGSVVEWVLSHPKLPPETLPEPLEGVPCGLSLADRDTPSALWSALDGRVKPGLQLDVSLPTEIFAWQATATPAESLILRSGRDVPPVSEAPLDAPLVAPRNEPTFRRRRANGALVMEGELAPVNDEGWSTTPMRATLETSAVTVAPGSPVRVAVEVTNTTEVIDGVRASLDVGEGLAVEYEPALLPLFPEGTGVITLTLTVTPTFPAGTHQGTVELSSTVRPDERLASPSRSR